ncbi:MAG TPA: DNA primase [Firmicutes bacterium]|nr:DNA primase [Bacillota bacterium]
MIPESFINELKYQCYIEDIVGGYVNLKRAGRNLKGLCPFHSEKTPSFTVYPENGSYYCFGCGSGGDVITFIRNIENLDYVEAVRFLAAKVGMTVPEEETDNGTAKLKTRILEANRLSARFFHENLIHTPQALAYIRDRGLTDRTIRHFGLGFAKNSWDDLHHFLRSKGYSDEELYQAALISKGRNGSYYDQFRNRFMFPIIDVRGNVIGFGGRVLDDSKPKYLNSADTPVFKKSRNLFALNFAKNTKERSLILGEGYMDVIAMHQAGFTNAVATLGTSLTADQARMISQYAKEVIIAYDSDSAGQTATKRALSLFEETGIKVRILSIPDAKDPDEYIKRFGATRFKLLLEGCSNAIEFELAKAKANFDLETADGKVGYLKEAAKVLAGIRSPVEIDVYAAKIAGETEVSKEAVKLQVQDYMKKSFYRKQREEHRDLHLAGFEKNDRVNPQRRIYPKAARAEEGLISAVMKNPDFMKELSLQLTPEEFVTDFNRKIYEVLSSRLKEGKSIDLMALSSVFDSDQMGRISAILAAFHDINHTREEVADYVRVLKEEKRKLSVQDVKQMDSEQLKQYIEGLKKNK